MNFSAEGAEGYVSYLLSSFFVFLIALIMDFLSNQRKSLYMLAQAETMDRLAHKDIMTGLANRLSFGEKLVQLADCDPTYGIISIDMNNLKVTNDRYGHQEGDRLLKDFSVIVAGVCDSNDLLGCRTGGDEFVIVISELSVNSFEKVVGGLNDACEQINKDRKPLPVSFAYGCCDSRDSSLKSSAHTKELVDEVFKVADERMYACKAEMKKNAKAENR